MWWQRILLENICGKPIPGRYKIHQFNLFQPTTRHYLPVNLLSPQVQEVLMEIETLREMMEVLQLTYLKIIPITYLTYLDLVEGMKEDQWLFNVLKIITGLSKEQILVTITPRNTVNLILVQYSTLQLFHLMLIIVRTINQT